MWLWTEYSVFGGTHTRDGIYVYITGIAALLRLCTQPHGDSQACLFTLTINLRRPRATHQPNMSNLHDFLEQRAKFPFPDTGEIRSAGTTNISDFTSLEGQWKAQHAVRDETLVQKLCLTLKNILGDAALTVDAENYLLGSFSPQIELDRLGRRDPDWLTNPSEARVSFSNNSGSSSEAG